MDYQFKEVNKDIIASFPQLINLARKEKTPFFLIFEERIRQNYENFVNCFLRVNNLKIYYSVKTNFESKVLQTLQAMDCGAEISGGLDLFVAEKAGFSSRDIVFDGPYKSEEELSEVISKDIRLINVESTDEIRSIDRLAEKAKRTVSIGLRIDFQFSSINSLTLLLRCFQKKFGFSKGNLKDALKEVKRCNNLNLKGLLFHNTDPITKPKDYLKSLKALFLFALQLRKEGLNIDELNLGGGYSGSKSAIRTIGEKLSDYYSRCCNKYGFEPTLILEPGRAIVDNAVILVGRILNIDRKWALADISINDLGYKFPLRGKEFIVANKLFDKPTERINIGGPTVNPYDRLYRNAKVPHLEKGDVMVIFNVGAYTIPLATQFIRPRCAVYFKRLSGKIELIRKRENYKDVIKNQIW